MQLMYQRCSCLVMEAVHILRHHTGHLPLLLPCCELLVGRVGGHWGEARPPNIIPGPVPLSGLAAVHELLENNTNLVLRSIIHWNFVNLFLYSLYSTQNPSAGVNQHLHSLTPSSGNKNLVLHLLSESLLPYFPIHSLFHLNLKCNSYPASSFLYPFSW